ncbi:PKD domain-containing protein, partial [Stieleria sp.]|uniref:PKD domain-containing protein n=1 Tax=Stieleria sp. TaxID=2795976 RepID=UPI003566F850
NQRQNPNDQAFLDRVTRGDIQDAKKITDRFQPEAEASVALKLHTTADLNALIDEAGDSIPSLPLVDGGLLLPQIEFDFVLDATASAKFKNPTNPSDEAGEKRYTNELETLKLENVTIDIGSLLETFVEPVANVLGAALGPVSEIVGGLGGGSFLNENLPILKDIPGNNFKSLLDFLGDANRDDLNAFRQALGSLVEISSAVEGLLEDFEDRAIALGCFEYAKLNEQAESRTLIPCAAASAIDSATSVEATQFINAYNQATNTTGGIRPDFIFPTNFVKLLSGEDADLVSLNLPALDITAKKDIILNVGVAEAGIEFEAKVSTNLALVYDSVGLRRVVDAIRKDDEPIWEDLLKGLYIRSQDGKEIEVTISGDGQVGVDVELASGNVVAEADGSVSLDIVDPNEDGALRLDEIESLTGGDLSKVFCLFDAAASFNGKIDVRLEFFGLAGSLSDVPGAKDISEVNVDWNLSDILGSTCSTPEPVLASSRSGGRVIQIHTGPFARDRRAGDVSDEDGPAEIKVVEDDNKIIVTGFGGRTEVPFDSSLNPTIAIAGGPFGDTFDLSDVRTLSIQMDGRGGSDLLLGGRANDVIEGGDGSDEIDPGSGDDLVFTGTGTNLVFSSSGADTIDASENSSSDGFQYIGGGSHANEGDTVIGSAADDTITATNVEGGDGDDTIRGSGTGGTLHGGAGNDTIYGGDGNQTLIGGPGEDSLDGGPGEDSLLGGEDDDQLISGYGDVLVDGGSGTDKMMVDLAVELTGLNVTGIDVTLGAGSYSAKSIGGSFDELTTIYSGVEEIDFSTGNESDSITINGANVPASISAGAGEDTFHLISNAAEVELNAGADNDELVINRSGQIDPIDALLRPRRISGFGAADVTLFGNSLEKITMTLGDGDDRVRLVVPSAETRINGGGGDADTVIVDSLQARSTITAEQVFLEIDSTPSGIRDEFGEVGLLRVTADRLWVDNRDNTNALDFSVKNRDVLVAGLDGSLIENISGVGRVEFLGSTAAATQDTLEVIDTAESTKTFRIENDVVEVFQGSDVLVFEAESSGINLEYPVTPQLDGPFHVLFSEGTNPNNPGKHAYVIDGSRISVFDVVRGSSYRLLPSRSTPTPFSINVNTDAVFDPSGRFLFITGNFVDPDDSQSSINKIAIYERDVVTGELTLVETVDAIEPAPKGRIEIADIQVADDYVFLAIEELDDPNGSATRVYRFDRERNSQSERTGKLIKGRMVGAPVSGEPVDSVLDTDGSDDLFVLTQNGINLVVYRYSVDSGDDSVVRGPFESFHKPIEGTNAKIEIQPVRNNQPRKVYIVENDIVTVTQREGGGGDLRRIQGVNLPASEQTSSQLDSTDVEFNDDGSEIYINNDAQIQTYQLVAGGDTDGQFVNPAGFPTGSPVPIATSDLPVWNFIGTDSLARDPRSGRFIAPTANDEITVFSNSLEAIQTIVDGAPPTFEADSLKKLVFTKFRPGRGSAYGIAEGPEGGYLVEFTRSKKTEGEFNPRSILTPDDWEFDLLRDKKLEFAEDLVLADDKHLYVATAGSNGSNGGIQLFQRDRGTGDIDFQTTFEAFAPFDDARTLQLSPDGTKLWASSYDTIRSWTRDPDTGFLTEPKTATLSHPAELFVDPDSDFLFVALGGTDGGIATRLQSDVSNSVQFESLANATSVKRIGNQLYAGTRDGILKVYNVDKDGQLTLLQTVSGGSGGSGSLADIVDIVSSRRDRFVFAGSVEGTILAYARDRSTGRLAFAQRITQGIGSFNAAEGIEGMTSMTFDLSEQDYFADLLYVASPSGWSAIQVLPSFATSGASYRVGFDGNFGSLEVGSNVSTPGGDFTDIVRSSGTGNIPLTIRTFGGADEISIASQPSSLRLDTGDGNDFVSLRSVSGGETDVDLGNGEDTIEVNLPGIQSPAPVDVDGGPHSSGDQLIYISGSLTVEEPPSELTTPTGQITIGTDKIIDWVEIESLLALDNLTADITSDDPEIAEGDELTLTATASSIGRTIPDSSFLWDLDSDGLYGDAIGGSITLGWDELQNLGIDDDGSYPISVQVQFDGLRSVDVTTLTVNNTVPSPEITVSPTTVEQFSTISLVLASDDPGNDTIERWEIDWESDGTIDDIYFIRAGTVTHVYQTAGTKDITATAYDEDGGPYAAPTATVQVNAIPPRVRAITGDQSLDEGDTGTYTLTASTLEAGGGTTTAVSWLVNFGDGTIESVSGSTAGPTVTHTYADDGMYTISALVVESDGTIVPATTTLTVSVANVANPMISVPADFQSNTGLDFLGAEGRPFELILTNDDPGDDTTTEWRIDWDGDGPMPPQSYSDAPQNLTTVEFIYTSEFPPPLEIRAVMIDEDGEHPTNVLFGEIANTPPTPLIIGETNNAVEASPFVVTLDPGTEWINTQIVRWRIERSDGAEVEIVQLDQPSTTVTTTLEFPDGDGSAITINAFAIDDEDQEFLATLSVPVLNVPPTIQLSGPPAIEENNLFTLTFGEIVDPAVIDTVEFYTVHWGDGTSTTYTAAEVASANGVVEHLYVDDPPGIPDFRTTLSVDLEDEDGLAPEAGTFSFFIENIDPVADPGGPYQILIPETQIELLGSATDQSPEDTFTFEWDFDNDGEFDDAAGPTPIFDAVAAGASPGQIFYVALRVTDDDGGVSEPVSTTVQYLSIPEITDLVLPTDPILENQPFTLTVLFEDTDPKQTHTVTVLWGDETSSEVLLMGGEREVEIPHTYLDDDPTGTPVDPFDITVTVANSAADDEASTVVDVNNVNPEIASFTSDANSLKTKSVDNLVLVYGDVSDVGSEDTHTAVIDWGDGSELDTLDVDQLTRGFAAQHDYPGPGIYEITATVIDDDGGVSKIATTAAVIQGVGLVDGTLFIIGTDGRDHVTLHYKEKKDELDLNVKFNQGAGQNHVKTTFQASSIQRIVAFLCGGDDHYQGKIDGNKGSSISIRQIVFGGDGRDHLQGGDTDDALLGGSGKDDIKGRGGNDLLIGGHGEDKIYGDYGDDLLIGDAIGADESAVTTVGRLDAALQSWAAAEDPGGAVSALSGIIDDGDDDRLHDRKGA